MKDFTKGVVAVVGVYMYGKYKYKCGRIDERKRLTRVLDLCTMLIKVNKKAEESE